MQCLDISTGMLRMDESSKQGTKAVRLEKWDHISSRTFFLRKERAMRALGIIEYNGAKRQLPAPLPLPDPIPLPMPLVVRRAPVLEPLDPPFVPWPPMGT